jgi:hypothetical protein
MNTRQFIEIAADTYVRGPEHRAYLNKRADVTAPIDVYLDQLWGPSFTPAQALIYRGVLDQLYSAVMCRAIKTYRWPMYVVDSHPSPETIDESIVVLSDFQAWVKANTPAARPDWVSLVMAATQPAGDPVQPASPGTSPVQIRTKRPRGPVPSATKSEAYLEGGERLVAVAQELVDGGQKLTAETLGKALEAKYRNTKASMWKRDYIAAATMASIKSQINHDQ